jgi:hypothetical protein
MLCRRFINKIVCDLVSAPKPLDSFSVLKFDMGHFHQKLTGNSNFQPYWPIITSIPLNAVNGPFRAYMKCWHSNVINWVQLSLIIINSKEAVENCVRYNMEYIPFHPCYYKWNMLSHPLTTLSEFLSQFDTCSEAHFIQISANFVFILFLSHFPPQYSLLWHVPTIFTSDLHGRGISGIGLSQLQRKMFLKTRAIGLSLSLSIQYRNCAGWNECARSGRR